MYVTPRQQALAERAAGHLTHHPTNETAHTGKTDDQATTEKDRANENADQPSLRMTDRQRHVHGDAMKNVEREKGRGWGETGEEPVGPHPSSSRASAS